MRPALLVLAIVTALAGCSVPRWPVEGRLTSPYGLRRTGLDFRIHRGVDISVPLGTEVRAMAAGTVTFAGRLSGYGRVIVVDHGSGYRSVYAHLSEIRVSKGQALSGRPVIGLSGSSGRSTGAHLHFEILRYGRAEDPIPLLGGTPKPRR